VKLLFAASEMTPFAKTGGLGDMVGSLPAALTELGHEVTCCLPFYRCAREAARKAAPAGLSFRVPVGSNELSADILELKTSAGVRVLFVQRDEFFDRSELYHTGARDYEDNAERFIFFSKAVAELLGHERYRPDVLHCHDWQTAFALVEALHRQQTRGAAYGVKTVFTIHNLASQGLFPATDFRLTDLPGEFFRPHTLEFYGRLNLMKGGLVFSDAITTVSPTYAQEIQTPEGGCGLDPVLRSRHDRIHGILNGADYGKWNPATDPMLKQNYSAQDPAGKRVCRAELLRRFNVQAGETTPVAAFISRLADQTGADLLLESMDDLLRLGLALVILGRGERRYEEQLQERARKHPQRVVVQTGYDEAMSHQVQGGADVLLVPSRFEPCGLTQLYALKYGTIPVVYATGGLADTVTPYDVESGTGHGFRFTTYSPQAFVSAVQQAVSVYKEPNQWKKIMENAMACDFSWRATAVNYEKLYAAL
jgi:starch synthase